ncbi:MAG: hypothetical protein PHW69_03590 [Elusimicrobiaceae bacterium]|nr:hypothetical protein [Elusimicrobiaceae bacterium]
MIRVNLIPQQYLLKQKQRTQLIRAAGVALLLVVGVISLTFMHINRAYSSEDLLRQKEKTLAELQVKVAKVKELEQTRDLVKAHLGALEGLMLERTAYMDFMAQLARTMPDPLWFESVVTNAAAGRSSCCGAFDFTVSAASRSGDGAAQWLRNMDGMKGVANVEISGINVTKEEDTGRETFKFSVRGAYSVEGGR